jgi:hypothetical protein
MPSFGIRLWWAVLVTGLLLLGLAVAGKMHRWGLVTLLSGFLVAGLFMVLTECVWWLAE